MALPDEDAVAGALNYLAKTDQDWATACAALQAAELAVKVARDLAFLQFSGTQAERAAWANTSPEIQEANKKLETAVFEKRLIEAKRSRALVVIDVWRSINSNKRAGIV